MTDYNQNDSNQQKKESLFSWILNIISGSFASVIGVLAGAGLLKALLSVLSSAGVLSSESDTYLILSAAGDAVFYFLPVFLGIAIADKLGANGYVGGVIGASLLVPEFTELVAAGEETASFLGLPVLLADYSSTVFPIFIAMFVYAGLEKILKRVIYKDIQLFINPLISLIVIVPLTMLVFGPIGTLLGEGIGGVISFLSDKSGMLAGAIMGSAWTFLTIAGLHWTIIPLAISNLSMGADPIIAMAAPAVFAQLGIAIAVFLKTKDKDLKAITVSGILPGAMAGTTEAINYGIILRFRRTMVYVIIAGAVGGAITGSLGAVMNDFVLPSVLSIPAFSPILPFILGVTASLILGFAITYLLGYESRKEAENSFHLRLQSVKPETIMSPLKGSVLPLSNLADPLFSTNTVGKGVAIDPEEGFVYSPVDGEVTSLFPTSHAVGITSDNGAEILISIGMETVQLKGEHFTPHVKQGDKVKKGDLIMEFDKERIEAGGYRLLSPVVVTNQEVYMDIKGVGVPTTSKDSELLRLSI